MRRLRSAAKGHGEGRRGGRWRWRSSSPAAAARVGAGGGRSRRGRGEAEAPMHRSHGWVIDSLAFSYIDEAGQRRTAGPWGGFGGQEKTICLGPSEFVKEVSGTTGEYENKIVVRSLKFITNITTYGPFGREQNNGTPFSSYGTVVGFHGRSGVYLDSIGTYTI
ncbi:hypothetical protein EJB05_25720, partial [Eragrostis curvula]